MRLSLRQLEVFATIAREGSTRAAAERLSRSQSAASQALAEIESRFGRELFDRVGRRLVLNADGRALLPQAISLLEHAREVEAAFEGAAPAVLRLAASMTIGDYLLPGLIARWRRGQPGAQVRLRVANTREVAEAVARLDADAGFVEGSIAGAELRVEPWRRDELAVFAAPTHPLARVGGRIGVAALAAADWILREPGSGTRETVDRALMPRLGWPPPTMELGSSEAIREAVAAGAGLGCLSRLAVVQDIAAGRLTELRTTLPALVRELSIVTHRERRIGPQVRGFLDACRGG